MDFLTIGIDLGGTKVKTAVVDSTGHVLATDLRPTQADRGANGVLAEIAGAVEECLGGPGREATTIGIGVAGQVDGDSGIVRFAPNLRWKDVPLCEELQKSLGLPVLVTNDVRAATFGEWNYGAAAGVKDLVCLFVGTGIGGGVVTQGRMLEGANNSGGELGHMTVAAGGRRCHCPNRGCLEAYAGGWAIAERAQEAAREDAVLGQSLVALAGSIEKISAAIVSIAYHDGDPLAHRLVEQTAHYLSAGAIGLVNAFNPSVMILGGGIIEGIPEMIKIIADDVQRHALPAAVAPLRIAKAALGDTAGVVGAAAMAREKFTKS